MVGQEFKTTELYLALKESLVNLGFQTTDKSITKNLLIPIRGSGKQKANILKQQHIDSLSKMGLY